MKKKDIIGKWFNPCITKPSEIEDLRIGDYLIVKLQYNSIEWDYKLAWYDIRIPKNQIHIIEEPKIKYRLLGWTILPEFKSQLL